MILPVIEKMIEQYAPHTPLKDIKDEVLMSRDLPNDAIFSTEIENAIANFYMRVCEAKQNKADMEKLTGGEDESQQGKD